MPRTVQAGPSVRFGPYEVNLASGELHKFGCKIRLQPKSFLVLRSLLESPGELVTREFLRSQLWPENTFVEFESSLNVAVRRLREALSDEAQNPVYIETVPRYGYRFVGVVDEPTAADDYRTVASWAGAEGERTKISSGLSGTFAFPVGVPTAEASRQTASHSWRVIAGALALLVAMGLGALWRKHDLVRHSPPSGTPSIAVLPFVDTSPGQTQEYFSDGLAEELLNELANTPGLRVAARTSSFQFKGKTADLHTIGEKLNVATVLEGSVSEDGNRVRIDAALINVSDGLRLWSGSYQRDLNDVFAVQDEIARAVAKELEVKLLKGSVLAASPHTTSTEAYNNYLQGRYFAERRTKADLERAVRYYEEAIKLDPSYARAWSGLAWTRLRQANSGYGSSFEDGSRLAREAAEKALQLDAGVAEAHAALGWIKRSHDWDWAGADASFQKALALEPQNTIVLLGASSLKAALGRFQDALALDRRVVELDPLSVTARVYLGLHAYSAGELDLAADSYQKALEINPEDPDAHYLLSLVELQRAQPERALAELAKENRDLERWVGQALAYSAMGRKHDSDAALSKVIATSASEAAYQIAEVYAFRGEADLAFAWLDRAWNQGDMGLPGFQNDPLLKKLHPDPRYTAFLKRMRLA